MNHIEIILFDIGGVLVELTGVPRMLDWINHRLSEDELWEAWLNSPAVRAFELGQSTPETFAAQLIQEMELPIEPAVFIQEFTGWPSRVFPGVVELLSPLVEKYTVACFSNSNQLHWNRIMNEMNLAPFFTYQFASHLIGKIKPDMTAFQFVLDQMDAKPSSVLFLDDNELNVRSARKVGMNAQKVKGCQEIHQFLQVNQLYSG